MEWGRGLSKFPEHSAPTLSSKFKLVEFFIDTWKVIKLHQHTFSSRTQINGGGKGRESSFFSKTKCQILAHALRLGSVNEKVGDLN